MGLEGMTPEQMGMKKKDAPGFDLESVVLSPEMGQVLKRVNANYPNIAVEALAAQRNVSAGEDFKQGIAENDIEAKKVWKALDSFLNENAVAAEIWLETRAKLDELTGSDEEMEDVENFMANDQVPYIRAAFANQPVTLLELLKEIKAVNIEVEAATPTRTPEGEAAGLALAMDRIQSEGDATRQANEVLKRIRLGM